jgi:hypothetical protein
MTKTGLFFVLSLALALPAVAQTAKPEAKTEAAKPEAAKPQAKAEPQPEAKPERKPMARKANPKRSEDARHCLDKGSNTEVIKCAEEYL